MATEGSGQPARIKALLITGDDVSAHPWREISETTREILVGSGRFDVRVCEDPLILESQAALKVYDVIVFTIYSQRVPVLSGQAQENLLSFVKDGKGFFVQHLAIKLHLQELGLGHFVDRNPGLAKHGEGGESRVLEFEVIELHVLHRISPPA
jgi:hypothetical protein